MHTNDTAAVCKQLRRVTSFYVPMLPIRNHSETLVRGGAVRVQGIGARNHSETLVRGGAVRVQGLTGRNHSETLVRR